MDTKLEWGREYIGMDLWHFTVIERLTKKGVTNEIRTKTISGHSTTEDFAEQYRVAGYPQDEQTVY